MVQGLGGTYGHSKEKAAHKPKPSKSDDRWQMPHLKLASRGVHALTFCGMMDDAGGCCVCGAPCPLYVV